MGLSTMHAGGKRQSASPPTSPTVRKASGRIPANQALILEVELLSESPATPSSCPKPSFPSMKRPAPPPKPAATQPDAGNKP